MKLFFLEWNSSKLSMLLISYLNPSEDMSECIRSSLLTLLVNLFSVTLRALLPLNRPIDLGAAVLNVFDDPMLENL